MSNNGTSIQSIPSTPIPPEGAIYLATALSVLEVFPIHPMVIAISIFNFVQIAQTQLLHNNLKLVLIAESAGIFLVKSLSLQYFAITKKMPAFINGPGSRSIRGDEQLILLLQI
jgi:hypothetical protein